MSTKWEYNVRSIVIHDVRMEISKFQDCTELLEEVKERIRLWGFGSDTNVLIPVITAVSCELDNEFRKTVEKLSESIVR